MSELFPAVLQGYGLRCRARPWRDGRVLLAALLGGAAALGVVAYLNGRRLGVSPSRLWATVVIGLASVLGGLGLGLLAGDHRAATALVCDRVLGVAAAFAVMRLHGPADRAYHTYNGGAHAYGPSRAMLVWATTIPSAAWIALIAVEILAG